MKYKVTYIFEEEVDVGESTGLTDTIQDECQSDARMVAAETLWTVVEVKVRVVEE